MGAAAFVDRHQELAFLNSLIAHKRLGPAQTILMYGWRVGTSELLLRWTEPCGLDYVSWKAVQENAKQQRADFWKLLNVPAFASLLWLPRIIRVGLH